MSNVAIIPARGGSKRIPSKNLKLFDGLPMIVHSIRTALKSGLFEQVVVSTDDAEIAEVALAHGAQVPFLRPARLADDFTGTAAVIVHALQQLPDFDYACCVYATAPLLQARFLREGFELLERQPEKSFTFSVCRFGFPVQRALTLDGQVAINIDDQDIVMINSKSVKKISLINNPERSYFETIREKFIFSKRD